MITGTVDAASILHSIQIEALIPRAWANEEREQRCNGADPDKEECVSIARSYQLLRAVLESPPLENEAEGKTVHLHLADHACILNLLAHLKSRNSCIHTRCCKRGAATVHQILSHSSPSSPRTARFACTVLCFCEIFSLVSFIVSPHAAALTARIAPGAHPTWHRSGLRRQFVRLP